VTQFDIDYYTDKYTLRPGDEIELLSNGQRAACLGTPMKSVNYVFSSLNDATWTSSGYSSNNNINIYIDSYECYDRALNFKNTAGYAIVNAKCTDAPAFDPDQHILVPIKHATIKANGEHVPVFDDLAWHRCPGVEVFNLAEGVVRPGSFHYIVSSPNYFRVDKTILEVIQMYQRPENEGFREIPITKFILDTLN
jgi:hypothetical protein